MFLITTNLVPKSQRQNTVTRIPNTKILPSSSSYMYNTIQLIKAPRQRHELIIKGKTDYVGILKKNAR